MVAMFNGVAEGFWQIPGAQQHGAVVGVVPAIQPLLLVLDLFGMASSLRQLLVKICVGAINCQNGYVLQQAGQERVLVAPLADPLGKRPGSGGGQQSASPVAAVVDAIGFAGT